MPKAVSTSASGHTDKGSKGGGLRDAYMCYYDDKVVPGMRSPFREPKTNCEYQDRINHGKKRDDPKRRALIGGCDAGKAVVRRPGQERGTG